MHLRGGTEILMLKPGTIPSGAISNLNRSGRRSGASQLGQLSFYQKDPASWNIVEGGASGKMKFSSFGGEFDFVFNGHCLQPGAAYSLIFYPGPWRGAGLSILGADVADKAGSIHITGSVAGGLAWGGSASSLWLVRSSDVNAEECRLIGWKPEHYLFGHDMLTFDDSGEEDEVPERHQNNSRRGR